MQKVLRPFKSLLRRAKENPVVAIGVAVLTVLLVAGIVALAVLSGGGGEGGGDRGDRTKPKELQSADKSPEIQRLKKRKVKPAPVVRGAGTLDVARSVGPYAVAQARGLIKNPSSIAVRVSAAPKQKVTVDYQLSCYREGGTKVGKGGYTTRPPDVRNIPLPMANAKECVVTVGAQLTSSRPGRVKVKVTSG